MITIVTRFAKTQLSRSVAAVRFIFKKMDYVPIKLKLEKRSLDISATYDGLLIVREKFRALFIENEWRGLEFRALPLEPGFYQIVASERVEFDYYRRNTRFSDKCEQCGEFRSVAGATPAFLGENRTIPAKHFVRTDLEFGTGLEKSPLLICGTEVGQALRSAKLKGLELKEILTE